LAYDCLRYLSAKSSTEPRFLQQVCPSDDPMSLPLPLPLQVQVQVQVQMQMQMQSVLPCPLQTWAASLPAFALP
jgi:hypothetical protein